MSVEHRYNNGNYLLSNPNWHREDASWKASNIERILIDYKISPKSIAEIGCGSGEVLRYLQARFLLATLVGYDISPQASKFWNADEGMLCERLSFILGDFLELNKASYDLILMLDVFEHMRDPFSFLEKVRQYGKRFIFHIPLDLSAFSVLRQSALLKSHREVGHLHFYTKDLALEILTDCGYKIVNWRYTGAHKNAPTTKFKVKMGRFPRTLACTFNRDWGVRLFGGETLIVLAE
jgi:cyclopropane fatty-acyl-phospholipid synthase-like methyltransferase